MIYLCEVVSQGVWSFGSTLCTQIIYDVLMELLILLNQNHTNRLHGRGHIYQEIIAIVWWTKHGGCC